MNEKMNPAASVEIDASEVKKVRIEKLNDLTARGMNPFEITSYNRTHTAGAILSDYEGHEGLTVSVAGRLMSKRVMVEDYNEFMDTFYHGMEKNWCGEICKRKDEDEDKELWT